MAARARSGVSGVTLIELLVVLFIMGIMMGMLLPTLGRVRARADVTVCENNVRQLQMALSQFIQVRRTFPRPNEWTVDLLPWIEQQPLFDQMRNRSPNASFPRPPLMVCPLQNEPSTWIPGSSTCHYMLVVDRRQLDKDAARNGWQITDRELLSDDEDHQPWFVGPEISPEGWEALFSTKEGPHAQAGFFNL